MNKSKKLNNSGQKLTSFFQKLTIFLSFFLVISLQAKEKITLGLTGVTLKEDIETIMNFKNYLSKYSDVDLNLKFAKSYSIMESFIINGDVDLAYVCGSTYINLKDSNLIDLLVIPLSENKTTYGSLIITKKDREYKSFIDLKKTNFAMSDPESNSGSLIPFYEILKLGYNKDKFFKKIIYTYDHGESIQAVLNGFVNAASVDSMVYQSYLIKNPNAKNVLKIIENFDNYPIPPFIIKKSIDEKLRNKLLETLLNMHKNKFGNEILKVMTIDKFIKPDNINYEKISKIKKFVLEKKNSNDE
jgi:phosphonate transport system substrate-binding protein